MTQAPSIVDLSRRTDMPAAFDERTMLTTFLNYTRLTVHQKCVAISQDSAGNAPLGTSPLITIAGLVSHLRWVEAFWFDVVFLGRPDQAPYSDDDPDGEMRIGPSRPIQELLQEYADQCARNDAVIAATDLDAPSLRKNKAGEPIPLKWIITHLIEETARHNGHIDLLREIADGVTGD